MDIKVLQTEIAVDPLGRGYSGMLGQEVVDDINTKYRTRDRASMTASEVANQIDVTEWGSLVDADQAKIWDVLHMGSSLNPFGIEASIFQSVFGASTTVTNLQAARLESISRAMEIGIGRVKVGHVESARGV